MELTAEDRKIIKEIADEYIHLSDYGLERFLEPEEIDKLTVAEYRAYESKLNAYRDDRSVIETAVTKGYVKGLKEAAEEIARHKST